MRLGREQSMGEVEESAAEAAEKQTADRSVADRLSTAAPPSEQHREGTLQPAR